MHKTAADTSLARWRKMVTSRGSETNHGEAAPSSRQKSNVFDSWPWEHLSGFGERVDDNARICQIGFSRAGLACDDLTLIISAMSFAR